MIPMRGRRLSPPGMMGPSPLGGDTLAPNCGSGSHYGSARSASVATSKKSKFKTIGKGAAKAGMGMLGPIMIAQTIVEATRTARDAKYQQEEQAQNETLARSNAEREAERAKKDDEHAETMRQYTTKQQDMQNRANVISALVAGSVVAVAAGLTYIGLSFLRRDKSRERQRDKMIGELSEIRRQVRVEENPEQQDVLRDRIRELELYLTKV